MPFIEFLKTVPVIVWYGLSLVAVLIGDFTAKHWSLEPRWSTAIIIGISYMLSGIFFLPTLLKEGLIIAATIWMLTNIIGYVVIGFFVFHEKLGGMQIAGIAVAVVAIILLSWPQHTI